ncbi:restriction endonuclease subunit S [Vibrio fluvialis]|nr:restriction endonuclease subunit S [Vibrio fluvialis]
MSWPLVKLGEVAPSKALKNPVVLSDDNVWQLNLDMVESNSGRIINKLKAPLSEAGSSTHWFDERHVLYSKLRPYLNKVVLPDEQGLATTELVPMLPDPEVIDRRYLVHYLRSQQFVSWISDQVAGAKMPRVSMKVFWDHEIPLPPLVEQKRIAAILDKADAIRQKRKQAIELADEFLRSVFLDMFGDPVTNPKGWEIKTIGELATKVTDGEHQTPKRQEKGYKLLSARNVQHGFLDVENEKVDHVGEAEFQRITKRLSISKSDVLLSCSGTIGRVSMNTLNEPFCLVRSVAVIRLAEHGVIPEFLVGYLGTSAMQAIMKKEANSSGQPNLFQNQIKQLNVLVPPLELQAEYKRFLDHYKEKKVSLIAANDQQALLFKSLSQNAFSGQL